MTTLDIRANAGDPITEIQFDESSDRLYRRGHAIGFLNPSDDQDVALCTEDSFDDFIAALNKARELWLK